LDNKNLENLVEIIESLQDDGKEAKITLLPSTVNQKRKMQMRRHSTTA